VVDHVRQKFKRICAFIGRVSVWEKLANVTGARGAKQRICYGMGQNISVRVPQKPQRVWYFHAAQNELSVFGKCVNIIANSAPQKIIVVLHV
jgi:hypothetical protein